MGVFKGKSSSLSTQVEASTDGFFDLKVVAFVTCVGGVFKFEVDVMWETFSTTGNCSRVSGVALSVG